MIYHSMFVRGFSLPCKHKWWPPFTFLAKMFPPSRKNTLNETKKWLTARSHLAIRCKRCALTGLRLNIIVFWFERVEGVPVWGAPVLWAFQGKWHPGTGQIVTLANEKWKGYLKQKRFYPCSYQSLAFTIHEYSKESLTSILEFKLIWLTAWSFMAVLRESSTLAGLRRRLWTGLWGRLWLV